jgi:hypothetical protein
MMESESVTYMTYSCYGTQHDSAIDTRNATGMATGL